MVYLSAPARKLSALLPQKAAWRGFIAEITDPVWQK